MRILLTGATGYIGLRLARRCVQNEIQTHVLVRPSSRTAAISTIVGNTKIHIYNGTKDSLHKVLAQVRPDVVMHLASLFLVQHAPDQVRDLVESNILFGSMLLEAMVQNSVYGFINAGTFWQHFEQCDYNPTNLYAATKQAFVDILRFYVEATPLKALTLELPDAFGPSDPRRKIVNILLEAVRTKTPIDISAGEQYLDLVHVDDVVDAFITALRVLDNQENNCSVYSVTSGNPVKLKDLVAILDDMIAVKNLFRIGARPYRMREVMTTWRKGSPLPGWRSTRSIEEFFRLQIAEAK